MVRSKKLIVILTTLAAVSLPTLAFADEHDGHARTSDVRRDDMEIARLRVDIAHRRADIARDERAHRFADARRDRAVLRKEVRQLERLMRDHRVDHQERHDHGEHGGHRR